MIEGFRLLADHIPATAQKRLIEEVLGLTAEAPFFRPTMPGSGKPMSVQMTNLGPLGWVSDISGYRYERLHPETGRPWPSIPQALLELWRNVSGYDADPQACLVNFYSPTSRLGLHVDADETAKDAPVVSVSLGDRALFRLGGQKRSDSTSSFRLASGDVVVLGGQSRHAFHGIDRIYPGTSRLVPGGGRINLTLRRVTAPQERAGTAPDA
ncbi:MAG: alpha-ketoglutarate-dependent dioxygenase AlkB [Alphaproteobacteria bacterium]|nr:alpha-ketoglutarate-dependent dioxygenase AlkB [Alphaproteobacteria bacterium]